MTSDMQGRDPSQLAENEQACEWAFIGGGLCGLFAVGFFAGQMLVELVVNVAGW